MSYLRQITFEWYPWLMSIEVEMEEASGVREGER